MFHTYRRVLVTAGIVFCLLAFNTVGAQEYQATVFKFKTSEKEFQPELAISWHLPSSEPNSPGGFLGSLPLAISKSQQTTELPNLHIISVQIVDGNANPITPVAGEGFFVRVDWAYTNAVCTPYTISRTVNGWTNIAPELNWGCGYSWETYWCHYWGCWTMHHGGTYSVSVTVDANNAITESDENDNTATISFSVSGDITPEWKLVNAEYGLENLGDGTDVIVGTMDDAFDFYHPWYSGNDSEGNPRLVASNQNSLGPGGSPVNCGHATAVMGIVLAKGLNDGDITGLAPDARYVTAEFINRASVPGLPILDVVDAAGFLVKNNVDVINMAWAWWYGTTEQSMSGETSVTNLMVDYLSYGLNIVCVSGGGKYAPGTSRNNITVGGLDDGLQCAWGLQDHGPTLDGRCTPDLLGNNAANAVAPSEDWRNGFPSGKGYSGVSFSIPFVTGAVAQMIDYGRHHNQNLDHRVIKAVIMNSGVKAKDANGAAWSNSPTHPLDDEQGTGILDMRRVYAMYAAGKQPPKSAKIPGYDLGEVIGTINDVPAAGQVVYRFGQLQNTGAHIDVTIVWDRHAFWNDNNGNGIIDNGDSFYTNASDQQDNLDIVLYRNGTEIACSRSQVDNVEHISLTNLEPGEYELQVQRLPVTNSGNSEEYAIAWYSDGEWNSPILADFDNDGDVDALDLYIFADQWLLEKLSEDVAPDGGDGIVNFIDWAVFANSWQGNMNEFADFTSQWLKSSAYCADIAPAPAGDGIVNMLDFAVFADNWLEGANP